MFSLTRNNKAVCNVSKVELFMSDVEKFEATVLVGKVANDIVLHAINDAELNGVYATYAGLMKRYNKTMNDGVWAGLNN